MAAVAYRPPMLRQPQPLVSLLASDGSERSSPVAPAAPRGRLSALALSLDSAAPVRASCAALPAVALAYCAWRNARRRGTKSRTWRAAIGIESEEDLASFIQPGRRKAAQSTVVRMREEAVDVAAEDDLASFIQPGRVKPSKRAPVRMREEAVDAAVEDDLASFIQPGRVKPSKRAPVRTVAEEVDVEKQGDEAREAEESFVKAWMEDEEEYMRIHKDDDNHGNSENSKRGEYKRMFQDMWRQKDREAAEQGVEIREGFRASANSLQKAQVSSRTMDDGGPNLNDVADVAGGVLIRNKDGFKRRSDAYEAREEGAMLRPQDIDEELSRMKPIFARDRTPQTRRQMYLIKKGREKNAPRAPSPPPVAGTWRAEIEAEQAQNPGRWHTVSNARNIRVHMEKTRRVRAVDSDVDPLAVHGEFGDPLEALARRGLSLEDIQVRNFEAKQAAKREAAEAAKAGVVVNQDSEMDEGLKAFIALDEVERAELIDHRTKEALRYVQAGDMAKANELFAEVKQITSVFKSLHETVKEEDEDPLDAVEKLWYKMQKNMHKEDFSAIFGSKAPNRFRIGTPML